MERRAPSPGWTLRLRSGQAREAPVSPSLFGAFNCARLRGARGRGHSHGLGRFLLVLSLVLRLRFLIFLFGVAHFDTALEDRAFFDADAMRDHVAREQAFAAD